MLNLEQWEVLKEGNPDIPGWEQAGGDMKTSADWLIDQCGFKGYRKGNSGVSDKHALVLVNYGGASGTELWAVAQEIMKWGRR